jgi:hypothetical protein
MMRKSMVSTLACTLLLLFPSTGRGDFSRSDWSYFKEIQPPDPSKAKYAFFQVDSDIYDGSAGMLHDIRIIDSDMREIPYQVVMKRESEKRQQFFPKLLNNSYRKDEYNSFVLDLGKEPPRVNEISILTSSKNFMRRVSVEGGYDQMEWNLLTDKAYIYDFSRNVREKYLRVGFPTSNFRFLLVKVFDDGNGPLEIRDAETFRVKREDARTESWPLKIMQRTENESDRTTILILDAGYRGLPIRKIKLEIASQNYHRTIRAESSAGQEQWTFLGSGVIFDYDVPGLDKAQDQFSFRENAGGRYFRLTIENYDDQPLQISGASGSSLVRRVVMPLDARKDCRVYFGNPKATTPRYDLAYRIPYLETENLPRLTLNPRLPNPDYVAPTGPWTEEHSYLLWVIMAGVIIILGLLIFSLWRKTPPETGTG